MTSYFKTPPVGVPMQTYSGHIIDLAPPYHFPVFLEDIVWPLSRIVRYNGQTGTYPRAGYSVLSHSMFVCDLVPERLKGYALLHDAHEAYIGDIIQPVKEWLFGHVITAGSYSFKDEVRKMDEHILRAFGLKPLAEGSHEKDEIHDADILALHYERKHFFPGWKETKQKHTGFTEYECWPDVKQKRSGYTPSRRPMVPYVDMPAHLLVREFCARLDHYTPGALPLADPEGGIHGEDEKTEDNKDTRGSSTLDKLQRPQHRSG